MRGITVFGESFPAEGFSGLAVECGGDGVEVVLGVPAQVGAFGEASSPVSSGTRPATRAGYRPRSSTYTRRSCANSLGRPSHGRRRPDHPQNVLTEPSARGQSSVADPLAGGMSRVQVVVVNRLSNRSGIEKRPAPDRP